MNGIITNPFAADPDYKSCSTLCFTSSVISEVSPKVYEDWIIQKYINCFFKPDAKSTKFFISVYNAWSFNNKVFFKQRVDLDKGILDQVGINIMLILRNAIARQMYPYGVCDENVIANAPPGTYTEDCHYIITGLDDIRKMFFVKYISPINGYYEKGIDYETYFKSIFSLPTRNIVIDTIKYNPESDLSVNLTPVANDLEDYIMSRDSYPQHPNNRVFGFEAVNSFAEYLLSSTAVSDVYVPRYLLGLKEHKQTMLRRIELLAEQQVVDSAWIKYAADVVNLADSITPSDGVAKANEYCETIKNTIEIERAYLPRVLEEIRSKCTTE